MNNINFQLVEGRSEYSYTSNGLKKVFQVERSNASPCVIVVLFRIDSSMPWVKSSIARSLDGENGLVFAVNADEGVEVKLSLNGAVVKAGFIESED